MTRCDLGQGLRARRQWLSLTLAGHLSLEGPQGGGFVLPRSAARKCVCVGGGSVGSHAQASDAPCARHDSLQGGSLQ